MKFTQTLYWLLAFVTTIHALALPASFASLTESGRDLFKRKGGGGGRGGGGGGRSGGSRGGSTSSSSGGRTGGSRSGATSSTSNTGGTSRGGSGTRPAYGGGRYYGGGATTPYRSGTRRTGTGAAPFLVGGAALGVLGGVWLYGAYGYNYDNRWRYYNETSNMNETNPVQCQCARYAECGCDETNDDQEYINNVANDKSISKVGTINGTETLVVNGTLDNGTTAESGARSLVHSGTWMEASGLWVVVGGVAYTMWFM